MRCSGSLLCATTTMILLAAVTPLSNSKNDVLPQSQVVNSLLANMQIPACMGCVADVQLSADATSDALERSWAWNGAPARVYMRQVLFGCAFARQKAVRLTLHF